MAEHFVDVAANGAPPTVLRLFGERNSGTNFVEQLLLKNFPRLNLLRHYPWEKHNYFNDPYTMPNMVCVCVARSADVWVKSSFRAQHQVWHWARGLEFSEFMRHEWWAHFSGHLLQKRTRVLGLKPSQELMYERHPVTGERLKDIFELRALKLASYRRVPKFYDNFAFIRYEDVKADPTGFLRSFSDRFDFDRKDGFKMIEKNVARTKEVRMGHEEALPSYAEYSTEDIAYALSRLDLEQEALFGYRYSDGFVGTWGDEAPSAV